MTYAPDLKEFRSGGKYQHSGGGAVSLLAFEHSAEADRDDARNHRADTIFAMSLPASSHHRANVRE